MLSFLLEAHLPTAVVDGVRRMRPLCRIEHAASWRGGEFREASDERILLAALDEGLMLVTYDVGTIPAILYEWLTNGRSIPAVAFIPASAIAQNDVGRLVWRLVELYDDPTPPDAAHPIVYLR